MGLVGGLNQLTFAFGPSLVGVLRDGASTYEPALGACVLLQAVAAIVILTGPGATGTTRRPGQAPPGAGALRTAGVLGAPASDRL